MKKPNQKALLFMRSFAAAYPEPQIVKQLVSQLPWGHIIRLLQLDLLFYHLKLRCHVVVELKAVPFDPGFVGTLNMFLSAVDDLLRHPGDKPAIGLLLCRSKNKLAAEYALRGFNKPIGGAEWETQIVQQLPEELKGSLPTVEEIEAELAPQGRRE